MISKVASARADNKGWIKAEVQVGEDRIEVGERVLGITVQGGIEPRTDQEEQNLRGGLAHIGVPWTPTEFVAEALQVEHPFDRQTAAKDRTKRAIAQLLLEGPTATRERRKRELNRWRGRARELEKEEAELREGAAPGVRACWGNKRTLLFEEMAAAAGVPNPALVASYLRKGAPIAGEVPASGLFARRETPSTKTLSKALGAGQWSRKALLATVRPHADAGVDDEVLA